MRNKRHKGIIWLVITAIIMSTIPCFVMPHAAQAPSSTITHKATWRVFEIYTIAH
ncbi:MAG: hypothetical protein WBB08_00400 [Halobacteriota archaeon]